MKARWIGSGIVVGLLLLSAACGGGSYDEGATSGESTPAETAETVMVARASLESKSGSDVNGSATFSAAAGRVQLEVHVNNLPEGVHAAHIHAVGDCNSDDGKSAGGHWNPGEMDHGEWAMPPHHLGDLGNLEPDANGHATMTMETELWTIGTGADNDVVGKAIIIHAGADDFTSQPTGNAGGRIACGVIEGEM